MDPRAAQQNIALALDDATPTKLVLVGAARTGKTALVRSLCGQGFKREYECTLGAELTKKSVPTQRVIVNLTLVDIGGDENFAGTRSIYFSGAVIALLVCDVGSRESFEATAPIIDELRKFALPCCELFVVGNKMDLGEGEREVTYAMGQEVAQSHGARYIEASALRLDTVRHLFQLVAHTALVTQLRRARSSSSRDLEKTARSAPALPGLGQGSINTPQRKSAGRRRSSGPRIGATTGGDAACCAGAGCAVM